MRRARRPARRGLVAILGSLAIAAATLGAAGCGSADDPADDAATVFAASSLTEAFRAIDPDPAFSFAGSDQLAFQVEQGAPADVFASASPKYADALHAKGLVLAPRVFATNRVVVIVPTANPAGIRRVGDLADPGVKLVIGEPDVPIGAYTRTALARLGLSAALANVVSQEHDVKSIVAKVALGEADAGLAYLTDVRPAEGRVASIPIPARAQPVVEYAVAVVRSTRHRAEADAFVDRLLGEPGRAVLARLGFGLPRPR